MDACYRDNLNFLDSRRQLFSTVALSIEPNPNHLIYVLDRAKFTFFDPECQLFSAVTLTVTPNSNPLVHALDQSSQPYFA